MTVETDAYEREAHLIGRIIRGCAVIYHSCSGWETNVFLEGGLRHNATYPGLIPIDLETIDLNVDAPVAVAELIYPLAFY